jgi:hypothetical protein
MGPKFEVSRFFKALIGHTLYMAQAVPLVGIGDLHFRLRSSSGETAPMTDDEPQAAADRMAELERSGIYDELLARAKAKLPGARSYLRAAKWGFDEMVEKQHMGVAFIFHLAAIAAVARAVPEVLIKTDRKLSDAHRAVIGEWSQRTKPATTPVIRFLKTVRDLALHEGKLRSYATKADIHRNEVIIDTSYDVGSYDEQGERHDLLAELRWAFDWLETELGQIEARLPPRL